MGLLDFVFLPKIAKLKAEKDVVELIKALSSGILDRKIKAAEALGEIKDIRAIEPLIKALKDNDGGVREYAARALDKIKDARAVEPYIKALNDENSDVRKYAVKALGEIGDERAVESLIKALKDNDGGVREYAAKALKTRIADLPAIKFINYKKSKALDKIKDLSAVEPLIKALNDENSDVREYAVKALGDIKDERAVVPLIKALKDNDGGVREYAAKALDKIKDARAVEPYIKALNDENSDVRIYAVKALGEIKDARAVDPLIVVLNYGLYNEMGYAAKALGEIRDTRAVEPLIKALNDENISVKEYAVIALGEIKDARAVEPLIKALDDEDSLFERDKGHTNNQYSRGYTNMNYDGSYSNNYRHRGYATKKSSVREFAVKALGEIKDTRAVGPLIKALNDKNSDVSRYAVEALVALGECAVEPLIIALEDKNPDVRMNAKKAIYKIKNACNIILSNGEEQPVPCVLDTAKNIPSISVPESKTEKMPPGLEITRTVYDPVVSGFVSEKKLNYPEVSKWLNAHPPPDYWYILRIDNRGNKIDQWAVELETDIALSVKEAYIDGYDKRLPLHSERMQWTDKYVIRVPSKLGFTLPSDGAKRMYFRINIDCNIALQARYAISGNVKAGDATVPIEKKSFSYSCRLRELKALSTRHPEKVEKYMKEKALELYSLDAARAITFSFKLYDDINKMVEKGRYVEETALIAKLENLRASLENVKKFTGVVMPLMLVEESITFMRNRFSAELILKRWKDMNLFDVMMTELLKGNVIKLVIFLLFI